MPTLRTIIANDGSTSEWPEGTSIGDIRLGHLLQGHTRKLTRQEIEYLKSL